MSGILRLYPRAWRDRYGDELVALLDERPVTLLDSIDLFRGAIDAHLHPQVTGADARPGKEIPMSQRLLGVVAAIGGIAWILAVASMFALPRNMDGDRDTSIAVFGLAIGMALTGIALGELGSRRGSASSAITGHVIAVIGIVFAVMVPVPWPVFIIPLYGFPVLGLIAAVRGSRNDALPGWLPVVFGAALVGAFAGYMGSIETDPSLVLIGSIGLAALTLAWVAVSGRSARPSETIPA